MRENVNTEIEDVRKHFHAALSELDAFEADLSCRIKELETLRSKARARLGELKAQRDECIEACESRHRSALNEIEVRLEAEMNIAVRQKQEDIEKRLSAALSPAVW